MKKLALTLTLAGFLGAGFATPAMACKDGKCKMEHNANDNTSGKDKKKTAKAESCHMTAASAKETKSCCAKKDTAKAAATKDKKAQ
ncbi:hypothetical protein [Pontibacter kalidii]|uniref:hypothetical protein n=1 Tax=Pontibacter kalidii TaxID=2592049 RepID=UPI0022536F8E|nr:hypothetical protein [Pontibacter kalidii]